MAEDQNGARLKLGDQVVYQTRGKRPKLVLGEVVEIPWSWKRIIIRRSVTGHVDPNRVLKVNA